MRAEIEREGQVTDRYVEAIELLGSDNRTERLGGIHALQRIMHDSARRCFGRSAGGLGRRSSGRAWCLSGEQGTTGNGSPSGGGAGDQ
ncbi:hypothetical protein ABZ690_06810 [Streptomyces sp. NPDC006967]|uniref:hypothetical protein n=1 Tax=unclassified Streptomyces TaxID=2593676 RepID=UPI0011B0CC68|nr:hypothetical protein [Streptomyces sp. SM1]